LSVRRAARRFVSPSQSRIIRNQETGLPSRSGADYLAEHFELRTAWETTYEAKRMEEHRKHFAKVLQDNPGVPIKRIRNIPGNCFEWLYPNGRDCLTSHFPGIWRR
jgi:hypothetical protein